MVQNDYYALYKTFKKILKQFTDKLPEKSCFHMMIVDLKTLQTSKNGLGDVLKKWKKLFAEDKDLLSKLCAQMLKEDKIKAIPQMLKLSKFRKIFDQVFATFEAEEKKTFTYVQEKQF